MSQAWAIYYVMIAAHVLGGGYTLARGAVVHRLVLLIVALTVALELAGVSVLAGLHIPLKEGRLQLDLIVNVFEATGLLILALRFQKANWIILMMLLQSANMVADAFAFPDDSLATRNAMVDTANILNVAEILVMVLATAVARSRSRDPRKAKPFYVLPATKQSAAD